ncbi:MAG TPA: hypothetical protein VE868_06010 [Balneolaceae bacterium]|nr:hypothetical protein [Balneolaceae bacterium]
MKKICLKAAGWGRKKGNHSRQPLEFIFFCAFLPVFFGRSKNTIPSRKQFQTIFTTTHL